MIQALMSRYTQLYTNYFQNFSFLKSQDDEYEPPTDPARDFSPKNSPPTSPAPS